MMAWDSINRAVAETRLSVWGTSADQLIETFATYTDQTDADTSWITSDTAKLRVNVTNDNLDFNFNRDATYDYIYYDLGGALSDTAWVLRFKCVISSVTNASANVVIGAIGMSDTLIMSDGSTDFLGVTLRNDTGSSSWRITDTDAGDPTSGASDATFSRALTAETVYIQIIRLTSTTYKVGLYSDSAYSTLLEEQSGTCASTVDGLRYFNMSHFFASAVTGGTVGTIDDIEVKDGVTSW